MNHKPLFKTFHCLSIAPRPVHRHERPGQEAANMALVSQCKAGIFRGISQDVMNLSLYIYIYIEHMYLYIYVM